MLPDMLFRHRIGDRRDNWHNLFRLHAAPRHFLSRSKRNTTRIERRAQRWLATRGAKRIYGVEHIVLARERCDEIAGQRRFDGKHQRLDKAYGQQLAQKAAESQLRLLPAAIERAPAERDAVTLARVLHF